MPSEKYSNCGTNGQLDQMIDEEKTKWKQRLEREKAAMTNRIANMYKNRADDTFGDGRELKTQRWNNGMGEDMSLELQLCLIVSRWNEQRASSQYSRA